MPTSISAFILGLLALLPAQAQTPAPVQALHIAFVGKPGDARSKAYVSFLRQRFAKVDEHSRYDVDPGALRSADVVVLDWPQSEGVLKWFQKKAKPSSPLGPRAQWTTPTVLVGSAGLNLACAWDVKGGMG